MQGTCSSVASIAPSTLVSLTRRFPRLSLASEMSLSFFGSGHFVGTLLVTVETGDMIQVLASPTGSAGRIDTGGWVGVLPSLLLTTMFLFLIPSFLVGGLAFSDNEKCGREKCGREECGACLEPFWRAHPKDPKSTMPGTWAR